MRSPKRERERERRGAVRRNVAISLRDRTKHSPSAIAEIEACTCPVRKGRAPLSLLRLSTLARSLARTLPLSRVTCSSCFVLALSICRSRSPSKLSRTFSLSLSRPVPSGDSLLRRLFTRLTLYRAFTSSSTSSSSCSLVFVFFGQSFAVLASPLLPPYVTLYFSDLSPLLSLLLCRPSCLAMCICHNAIFVHGPRKRRKSLYACIVYAAIAEVESLIK